MFELKVKESFPWWRKYIFPIYNKEIPNLVFMTIYFGLILSYHFCKILNNFIVFTPTKIVNSQTYFINGFEVPIILVFYI